MKIKVGTIEEMMEYLRNGQKILAIKLIRDTTVDNFKDAKEFVDMFCENNLYYTFGGLDRGAVIGIHQKAPNKTPFLVIDEELIFDPDLAAECPVSKDSLTEDEQAEVVEDVLETTRDRLSTFTNDALKRVLYRRFMNIPESLRGLTLAMLNDKFFHL